MLHKARGNPELPRSNILDYQPCCTEGKAETGKGTARKLEETKDKIKRGQRRIWERATTCPEMERVQTGKVQRNVGGALVRSGLEYLFSDVPAYPAQKAFRCSSTEVANLQQPTRACACVIREGTGNTAASRAGSRQ